MARTLNGNTTGSAAHGVGEDDLTRPTDAILAFIKANTDGEEYRRRFDQIYSDFRWLDYEMYVNELRAWRAEIAEAQARRVKNPVPRITTQDLSQTPTYREMLNAAYMEPMQGE